MNFPKGHPVLETLLSSLKTHKWWWAGGGAAAILVIAVGVAYSLYGESWFGPSGKTICTAALSDARNYGVVPGDAALANDDAKETKIKGRRVCTAQSGSDTYLLTADITCKKIKDGKCLSLYAVERADGLSLYQVRSVPDDETAADAAVIPPVDAGAQAQSAQPAAQPAQASAPQQPDAQSASPDMSLETVTGKDQGMGMQQQPSGQPQQ